MIYEKLSSQETSLSITLFSFSPAPFFTVYCLTNKNKFYCQYQFCTFAKYFKWLPVNLISWFHPLPLHWTLQPNLYPSIDTVGAENRAKLRTPWFFLPLSLVWGGFGAGVRAALLCVASGCWCWIRCGKEKGAEKPPYSKQRVKEWTKSRPNAKSRRPGYCVSRPSRLKGKTESNYCTYKEIHLFPLCIEGQNRPFS